MRTNLDAQLMGIAETIYDRGHNSGLNQEIQDDTVTLNKAIAQIKQCFLSAGWYEAINENLVDSTVKQAFKEEFAKYMTGQEWYDKFKKELWIPPKQERIVHNDDGISHDRFYRTGGQDFMYQRALEAARRASGLEKIYD